MRRLNPQHDASVGLERDLTTLLSLFKSNEQIIIFLCYSVIRNENILPNIEKIHVHIIFKVHIFVLTSTLNAKVSFHYTYTSICFFDSCLTSVVIDVQIAISRNLNRLHINKALTLSHYRSPFIGINVIQEISNVYDFVMYV